MPETTHGREELTRVAALGVVGKLHPEGWPGDLGGGRGHVGSQASGENARGSHWIWWRGSVWHRGDEKRPGRKENEKSSAAQRARKRKTEEIFSDSSLSLRKEVREEEGRGRNGRAVEEGKGAQVLVRTPGLRDITGQWPIRDGLCGPEWVLASHRGLGHQGVGKCSLMLAVGRCREPGGEIGPFGGLLLVLFEPPVARKC